jgi:hypothetical protein
MYIQSLKLVSGTVDLLSRKASDSEVAHLMKLEYENLGMIATMQNRAIRF